MFRIVRKLAVISIIAYFQACGGSGDEGSPLGGGNGGGGGGDTTPPAVSSVTPAAAATGVFRDVSISITFSESLKASTITSANVKLYVGAACSGTEVTGLTIGSTGGDQTVTIGLPSLLAASTQYTICAKVGLTDIADNPLASEFTASFTTGTGVTPLNNEFGADCSAGADTIAQVKTDISSFTTPTDLGTARTINQLIVTYIDRDNYFYVQKGSEAIHVFVSEAGRTGAKADTYGLKVGDEICLTVTRGATPTSSVNTPRIHDFSAIKKTGVGSITPSALTAAPLDNDRNESVEVTGYLTTKSSTIAGGGFNHILTYAGGTITIREEPNTPPTGRFTGVNQGDYIRVRGPLSKFGSTFQIPIHALMGEVSALTPPSYTVSGNITGLTANGLVLRLTYGAGLTEDVTRNSGNTTFAFTTSITGSYTVSVQTNPSGLSCNVTANNTGYSFGGNITNVGVTCATPALYEFYDWTANATAGVYPPAMTFRCASVVDPLLTDVVSGTYTGATNIAAGSLGVRGEGSGGISINNTGVANSICNHGSGNGWMSGIDISVNTTGKTNIRVEWKAAQISDQGREHGLRLQFSIDGGSTFTDVSGPIEFLTADQGTSTTYVSYGPTTLPASAENLSNLILRWRYYYITGTGSRTRIALDDVIVRGD